jgi:hypothetical protein
MSTEPPVNIPDNVAGGTGDHLALIVLAVNRSLAISPLTRVSVQLVARLPLSQRFPAVRPRIFRPSIS